MTFEADTIISNQRMRIIELEAKLSRAREALEPFTTMYDKKTKSVYISAPSQREYVRLLYYFERVVAVYKELGGV